MMSSAGGAPPLANIAMRPRTLAGTLALLIRCGVGPAPVAPSVWWPVAAGRVGTRAHLVMSRRHRRAHLQPPGSLPPAPAGPATSLEPATLAGVLEDHHYEQVCAGVPASTPLPQDTRTSRTSLLTLLGLLPCRAAPGIT